MYDPIKAVKNMISVPRKSHNPSLEFGIGIPIFSAEGCAVCDMAFDVFDGTENVPHDQVARQTKVSEIN
jgi:hypothetical protein